MLQIEPATKRRRRLEYLVIALALAGTFSALYLVAGSRDTRARVAAVAPLFAVITAIYAASYNVYRRRISQEDLSSLEVNLEPRCIRTQEGVTVIVQIQLNNVGSLPIPAGPKGCVFSAWQFPLKEPSEIVFVPQQGTPQALIAGVNILEDYDKDEWYVIEAGARYVEDVAFRVPTGRGSVLAMKASFHFGGEVWQTGGCIVSPHEESRPE